MKEDNFFLTLRNNDKIRLLIAGVVGIVHFYGVLQMFFNEDFFELFNRLRMFTNISNIFIFVVLVLYFTGHKDKKWFSYVSTAALISILVTGIVYHVLLNEGNMTFDGHIVHTVNPLIYSIFYFLLVANPIKIRHFWIGLVLPVIYFSIILIQGPFTAWYPYNFMDPTLPGKTIVTVLTFCLIYLLPAIAAFSIALIYLKNLYEKAINRS